MIKIGDLAHRVWQTFPYHMRRRLLFRVTALTAAKPDPYCQPTQPIVIAGFLSSPTGLGECARMFHDAYRRAGAEVYGIDLSRAFRQNSTVSDFGFIDGRGHRGPGTVMLHLSGPVVPLGLTMLGRAFLRNKWRIGYWAWELPALPQEWRSGAAHLHEIWAISQFAASAMTSGLERHVRVVLPPISGRSPEQDGTLVYRRNTGAEFLVLACFDMASSFARKNPLGALAAFKAAFGHDRRALLIVKVANADAFPQGVRALEEASSSYDNIGLTFAALSEQAHMDLIAGADAVLSLHRSEGFGLLLAHALRCGRPVVATDWSGSREFLNHQNACPIPAELVAARDPQQAYDFPATHWAEPSVAAAAKCLRRLRDDRQFAAALGRSAQQDATERFARSTLPQFQPVPDPQS